MIQVSDTAKEKLIAILVADDVFLIRFGLKGGGCSGFSYFLNMEVSQEDDDFEYVLDETHKLIVDATSMMYLENAEIDYVKDIMGESFVFKNPGVKTSCGCGASVSF